MGKGTAELVETPTGKEENLALITEVLSKRQEEADDLRIRIANLRHTLASERTQWEEQRRQEELGLRNKQLEMDRAHAERMADAEALHRARQEAYQQADREREAVVQDRRTLQQERQLMGDLSKERVEVERLRQQVVGQQQGISTQWQEAQANVNTANLRLDEATQKLAEVERRTVDLSQWQDRLNVQQEEIDVRSKHLNIVQETIGKLVEKLPVSEPAALPTPTVPETIPPVAVATPAVVESDPASTVTDAPGVPPMPPVTSVGEGSSGTVEVAPQTEAAPETPISPELAAALKNKVPEKPYVHPSQRRVLDGSQAVNDQ